MILRKEKLERARLYVVLGARSASGRPAEVVAEEAVVGGADIVQLRMKDASKAEFLRRAKSVAQVVQGRGALFIVNDDPDVALESGADGVHVGQDDLAVADVRRKVGRELLIGKSTHSREQALAGAREDTDYLGFGPIFGTPTKPDYRPIGLDAILLVASELRKPYFAIGGIDLENASQVLDRGASRIAVVRAVQDASDARAAAIAFRRILTQQEMHA